MQRRRPLVNTLLLTLAAVVPALAQTPTRLIQAADFKAVSTIPVPVMQEADTHWSGSRLYCNYAQGVIAFNPANNSLFLVCHDHSQTVAEFGVQGNVLQIPRPAVNLQAVNPNDPNSKKIAGLAVVGDRLFVNGYSYYDGANTAVASLFVRSTALNAGSASGPVRIGNGVVGLTAGYLGEIPAEWRAAFGGTHLVGARPGAVVSGTSLGPALSVVTLTSTLASPTRSTPLLGYPLEHSTLGGCESAGTGVLYNCASSARGVVFVPGTRSVLVFGTLGLDGICYKDERGPAACRSNNGGYQAVRYQSVVWAYDANELLRVKSGSKAMWDVRPYATWALPGVSGAPDTVTGATYDASAGLLYVSKRTDEHLSIHAFVISEASSAPAPAPAPPDA